MTTTEEYTTAEELRAKYAELMAQKDRLYSDAKRDGTIDMIGFAARKLGIVIDDRHGPKYLWCPVDWKGSTVINVYLDDYAGAAKFLSVDVEYPDGDRVTVLSTGVPKLFVPGPWQDVVLPLAQKAYADREKARAERMLADVKGLDAVLRKSRAS